MKPRQERMTRLVISAVTAALLLTSLGVLAACSSEGTPTTSPATATPVVTATPTATGTVAGLSTGTESEEAQVVDVSLKEWKVSPSTVAVKPGGVAFHATNNGTIDHEL